VFEKKSDRVKREKREALKLSEARKKEKEKAKKLARRQQAAAKPLEPPPNPVKLEENDP
jgi:hypothetical protein